MNWIRKVYRVFWDFPMNWQPFGWKQGEMKYGYWNGDDVLRVKGKTKGPIKAHEILKDNKPMRHPLADFYWYAKGWYKKGDLWSDLSKIQSRYSGVDENYITHENIINVLSKVLPDAERKSILDFMYYTKFEFINVSIAYHVAKYLIAVALSTKVNDKGVTLIELGEPDYSILGKKEMDN